MRLGADVAPTNDNQQKAVSLFRVVIGLKLVNRSSH